MNQKAKKEQDVFNPLQISKIILQYSVSIYVFIMFTIFPLYYQNKYFNMGDAKYAFYKWITIIFICFWLLALAVHLILNMYDIPWKTLYKNISVVDYFVLLYGIVVVISYVLTPYKSVALWGYAGWDVGLLTQLSFVFLYFIVSRYLKWDKDILIAMFFVSIIVYLIAIVNRFDFDPLDMYSGTADPAQAKILFLSTIGQATWYSSFLCTMVPIGIFIFWYSKRKNIRILLGIYTFIGFATLVTQNSDSAFIAMVLFLLVLFGFSFESNDTLKRFLQVVIIALAAFKVIGLLQILFPQRVIPLEQLSIFCSQSTFTLELLIFFIALYAIIHVVEKEGKLKIEKIKWFPKVVIVFFVILVIGIVLLVYLNSKMNLQSSFPVLSSIGYLNFDRNWGNGRGFTWSLSAQMVKEFPFINKLFGCGPDCYSAYAAEHYSEQVRSMWGDNVLTNAHNEWFTSLIFFGITGFITYMGIFISQVVVCLKNSKKQPFLIAIAMCIVSYMGHNLFCYQQVVCTSLIFILLGIGQYLIRNPEENIIGSWREKQKNRK